MTPALSCPPCRRDFRLPAVVAASPFNWPRLLAGSRASPPMLQEFAAAAPGAPTAAASAAAGTTTSRLASLPQLQRRAALADTVGSVVSSLLGMSVAADAPLMAAGLDSLGAVELRSSLEGRLGLKLPVGCNRGRSSCRLRG